MRRSNRLTSSSSTNTPPAIGALNAVASPAAAPAATRMRTSARFRRSAAPTMMAMLPPICTDGPSRPKARPDPMASSPPTYLIGRIRKRPGSVRPSTTASTRGMPLPSACGSTRCTSHAAAVVPAAQIAMTSRNPRKGLACAQRTRSSRPWPTRSSNSRKRAAIRPVRTPTRVAATTNPSCSVGHPSRCGSPCRSEDAGHEAAEPGSGATVPGIRSLPPASGSAWPIEDTVFSEFPLSVCGCPISRMAR